MSKNKKDGWVIVKGADEVKKDEWVIVDKNEAQREEPNSSIEAENKNTTRPNYKKQFSKPLN